MPKFDKGVDPIRGADQLKKKTTGKTPKFQWVEFQKETVTPTHHFKIVDGVKPKHKVQLGGEKQDQLPEDIAELLEAGSCKKISAPKEAA